MSEKFPLSVYYQKLKIDVELDRRIRDAASPGVWWAQGFDFGTNERDIAFDFSSKEERAAAILRITEVGSVRFSGECE